MKATNTTAALHDDPDIYTSLDALRRLQFKAQGFSFTPKQPVNSILAGKNASKLRGRGLNFEEMRQYHIGDDIRTMDWKVTIRTGKPHVKVYTEERERNVLLLVDQRQSMFFGSKGKMKSVIAAEIAALIAWKVIDSTDRVGGVIFNDNNAVSMGPKRSRNQVIQLMAEITRQNHLLKSGEVGKEHHLSLEHMLEQVTRIVGHDALVIFITDGYGWNQKCSEYIKTLSQHNEIIFCHVSDPLEHQLATMSQMVISDGDMQIEVSSKTPQLQQKFQQDVIEKLDLFAKVASKYRIPVLPFDTLTATEKQLRKALGL
ncbi:DUF58 domain-containing protein [Thalassotalea psychrophila]|uniref:DUF58 domain-containing protein n=1 Tax=Thalassotalea psychrophila TaxID=3065647 RepID=A0ABY9TZQ4_9GAMM|nr:DUF58 domain-containing protein [Colwelliaceae bacterium SQ149]